MDKNPNIPNSNKSDITSAAVKGGFATLAGLVAAVAAGQPLGAIFLTPFVTELFNVLIPNQRQDRIEKLLQKFFSRICNMNEEEIKQKWDTPEFLDIFEDCMNQGIRAISDERLEYLASVLEKSLTEEQLQHHQTKRLLSILAELNDAEIIILQSYGFRNPRESDFRRQHEAIFQYTVIQQGASEEEQEGHAMYNNFEHHLINSGLIGLSSSGSSQLHLTLLGKMLLKLINQAELVELAIGTSANPVSAIRPTEKRFAKIEQESKAKSDAEKDTFRRSDTQKKQELLQQMIRGARYGI
jgi:hypothetical protein